MPLDLFQKDNADQIALAARSSAPDLPATFSEGFETSWRDSRLFGQSIAESNARDEAILDHADEMSRKLGRNIGSDLVYPTEPTLFLGDTLLPQINDIASKNGLPPLTDDQINEMAIAKSRQARADAAAMSAREKTFGGSVGVFAGATAGGVTDPVNVLAFPLAAPAGAGIIGTSLAWAGIAGGTQTAIELLNAPYHEQVQPGYFQSGEPVKDILGAAVTGGVIGGGIKGLGAAWTRVKTGSWPRSIRDAGNVVESEANVLNTNPYPGVEGEAAHRTAMQQSIDALVAGRPVDVDNVVTPSILRAYEDRLAPVMDARAKATAAGESAITLERDSARLPATMERLSEQQLASIRDTARSVEVEAAAQTERLAGERQSVTAGRSALEQGGAEIETQRAALTQAQNDLAAVQERLASARPPTDPVTEARLAQIETDLAAPNLGAADRGRLEAERASISETLAKTAPGDARLIGSLEQEERGLQKTVARQQQAVSKLEARAARTDERLTSREKAIPIREQTGAERIASRRAAVADEMRRAVGRLASDGYGVRLPRTDAEEFASRILGASDEEVSQHLRDLTETLVDRATEARRAAPQPELPFGAQPPAAQKVAEKAYWTEQMRKGVTALAREVGYVMPREEAAAIAAHLAALPEHEAMAVLDELLLRPRTLAEVFPGTGKIVGNPDGTVPLGPKVPQTSLDGVYNQALATETTPKRVEEVMHDPATDEAVWRDLDRLRVEKGDISVPMEAKIGADGAETAAMQDIGKVIDDADMRLAAAKEIAACSGPQPEAG